METMRRGRSAQKVHSRLRSGAAAEGPTIDRFQFLLAGGCDVDGCRSEAAFECDEIDGCPASQGTICLLDLSKGNFCLKQCIPQSTAYRVHELQGLSRGEEPAHTLRASQRFPLRTALCEAIRLRLAARPTPGVHA